MSLLLTTLFKPLPLILLCATLSACATAAPPKTVSDGCLIFSTISYAQLPAGKLDDPGNKADTPETVLQISQHNIKHDAICGEGK